jgi:hypothetical protein
MNHTQEVPLPKLPDAPTLWAVHVQGPDDIVAEQSRESADRNAAILNQWYEDRTKEPDFDPKVFPRIHAEVIEWPYAREVHADALVRQAEDAA